MSMFTGLRISASGLTAERGTALYDSLIFSLYYFNGIKGQRALITSPPLPFTTVTGFA